MLALASAFLCLVQDSRPALDVLIERSERIVVARVERLHRFPGHDLLELRVSRTLYGPQAERVFALVPDGATSGAPPEASVIAFLEDSLNALEGRAARLVGDAARGSALTPQALWWVDANERVQVPDGIELPGLPLAPSTGEGARFQLVPLVEHVVAEITASVPSIRATFATTGPAPWSFLVTPGGLVHGRGASTESLSPEVLRALWSTLEDERFSELPRRVGASQGPCTPVLGITVRTSAGRKTVSIDGDYLERLSPTERDAAVRALRVWHALPIADEPR